jgi:uncharacterized protein YbaR (Trm112 family)
MTDIPALFCPRCRTPLEYHVTLEMLEPPIGKIDTGYCPACKLLFERVRQANAFYDTTRWPPLCRTCRQPVAFTSLWLGEDQQELLLYTCRDHGSEQWMLTRATDRWTRLS